MMPLYLATDVVVRLSPYPKSVPSYKLGLRDKSDMIRVLRIRCETLNRILRRFVAVAIGNSVHRLACNQV